LKILFSESALGDLEGLKMFYVEKGVPEVAQKFILKIFDHLEVLPDNPKIGRKVPEFNLENIRELIHGPFRIVYLLEKSLIHVVRIWRSERLLNLSDTPANSEI